MKRTPQLDTSTLRKLAVEASCDPRTIVAVLEGRCTRGLAYERARQAIEKAGYAIESPRNK